MDAKPKVTVWTESARQALRDMPRPVRGKVGYALWKAQQGEMPPDAKVLQGFGGANVVEIRVHYERNEYRAVYTVRFADCIYVLHVFQKKSKKGIKTPAHVIELIRRRLQAAEKDYEDWKAKKKENTDKV
jgi:phage-related protein